MATLFISDLHLDEARPEVTALFEDFLGRRASAAEALYVLGDLFEAWVGDDDDAPLAARTAGALKAVAGAGVPVYFVHGNRDFLVGERFAAESGVTILPEYHVLDLYGTPTLIAHGDTLCTDDADYQRFRAMVRSPQWQAQMLARPLAERRALARQFREGSADAMRVKPEDIMDVNAGAVVQTMRRFGVRRLIHGHTHRPAVHELSVDGEPAERIVLGDWYEQGSVLTCDRGGCRLEGLPH